MCIACYMLKSTVSFNIRWTPDWLSMTILYSLVLLRAVTVPQARKMDFDFYRNLATKVVTVLNVQHHKIWSGTFLTVDFCWILEFLTFIIMVNEFLLSKYSTWVRGKKQIVSQSHVHDKQYMLSPFYPFCMTNHVQDSTSMTGFAILFKSKCS
jgi:hypothetical protein